MTTTFLFKKKSGKILHKLFPNWYIPLYSMATFTRMPYKDAVEQGFVPPAKLEDWADIEMFTTRLPYLPEGLGERVEFITTYIMQSRRPDYKFYRGTNPLAKAAFGTAQSTLSALFRLRWKYKFFNLPLEMKLIESVLARRRKMVVETY